MEQKELSESSSIPDYELYTRDGERIDIPIEGSLGLLAYGYKGIMAWRKKRWEVNSKNEQASPKKE